MRIGGGCFRVAGIIAACFALVVTARPAPAQPHLVPEAALRALPAEADAMVVVSNAGRLRLTSAGQGLMEVLESGGNLQRTRRSWDALARSLGWTPDEAFDALLGQRVTVLLRRLDAAEGPDWALLTEVSPESERRLRTRLAAVPRRSAGGLAVMCIEDGGCQIVVARRGASERVTVLIGPGDGALFDDMAARLLERPALSLPAGLGQGDVMCLVRRTSATGEAGFLAVAASARDRSWRARIIATSDALWPAPPGEFAPWSDAPFKRVERDAVLAVMTSGGAGLAGTLTALGSMDGSASVLPSSLAERAQGKSMIVLRRAGESGLRRDRVTLASRQAGPRMPDAGGTLTLSIARESADLHRDVVEGDRRIAMLVASLQQGETIADQPLRMEVGVGDHEPRSLPLVEMLESNPGARSAVESVFGPEPILRWGITAAQGMSRAGERGWWYASLSPAATRCESLPALQSAEREGTLRRRISIGVIRPAELLRIGGGESFFAPLRSYRSVESLRWDAWVRDDGLIESELEIGIAR